MVQIGGGAGGSISIDTQRQVVLTNGGEISARSEGTGDAGRIEIRAGEQFTARDGGRVTTQADAASGGNIDIAARHLIYVRYGEITTSVAGGAEDGGNISLDPEFVVLDHANVIARAVEGNGGNINIRTDHFVPDFSSAVDASSELGIDGEIQITSPTVDLASELAPLDSSFLDASSKLARLRRALGRARHLRSARPRATRVARRAARRAGRGRAREDLPLGARRPVDAREPRAHSRLRSDARLPFACAVDARELRDDGAIGERERSSDQPVAVAEQASERGDVPLHVGKHRRLRLSADALA